jgi:hypothetical protein
MHDVRVQDGSSTFRDEAAIGRELERVRLRRDVEGLIALGRAPEDDDDGSSGVPEPRRPLDPPPEEAATA